MKKRNPKGYKSKIIVGHRGERACYGEVISVPKQKKK